ncbi:hypothetical protein BDW42DRAFT_45209 [Aspergillus taichungensis]|uniref:Uncharacterized protein n=1 Tax=Aspergillus taichungensis TaxID=482145 RepID=A0A2J5I3A5_9EURO|nr:hypothetical protein BDW42DRAFT_45209 [Aspergillus taichungensis]
MSSRCLSVCIFAAHLATEEQLAGPVRLMAHRGEGERGGGAVVHHVSDRLDRCDQCVKCSGPDDSTWSLTSLSHFLICLRPLPIGTLLRTGY